jgi:hypothetical protein
MLFKIFFMKLSSFTEKYLAPAAAVVGLAVGGFPGTQPSPESQRPTVPAVDTLNAISLESDLETGDNLRFIVSQIADQITITAEGENKDAIRERSRPDTSMNGGLGFGAGTAFLMTKRYSEDAEVFEKAQASIRRTPSFRPRTDLEIMIEEHERAIAATREDSRICRALGDLGRHYESMVNIISHRV